MDADSSMHSGDNYEYDTEYHSSVDHESISSEDLSFDDMDLDDVKVGRGFAQGMDEHGNIALDNPITWLE